MALKPSTGTLTVGGLAALLVAAFALLTSGQRAQTLGLTAHGDMVVATDGGAADVVIATRLPAGSNGYVLRSIGGAPTWRELSSSGTLASRPACAAGREGQEYWATDGATGLQRTRCVHQGAGTYTWTLVAYDVTATGSSLLRAADAGAAREAIGAAYDPTTTHGDLIVRDDAGLARVAVGTTGQVLTVGDAGVPVWRDPSGGGTVTAFTAADFTPTQGHASTSASIVSGRLRLSIDGAVRRYGTVSGTWTTTAPRGVLTLPSGAREVLAITRVYTGSGTATSYLGVSTALRGGTDPSDITDLTAMAGTRLPGTVHWDTGPAIYGGELRADSYPASTGISVVQWASAPTPYYGVRWTRGAVSYVGAPVAATSPDDVYSYPVAGLAPDWPVPTAVIVTLQQYSGATAAQIDVEIFVWVWT